MNRSLFTLLTVALLFTAFAPISALACEGDCIRTGAFAPGESHTEHTWRVHERKNEKEQAVTHTRIVPDYEKDSLYFLLAPCGKCVFTPLWDSKNESWIVNPTFDWAVIRVPGEEIPEGVGKWVQSDKTSRVTPALSTGGRTLFVSASGDRYLAEAYASVGWWYTGRNYAGKEPKAKSPENASPEAQEPE